MTKIHSHSFASRVRSVLPICAALLASSCSLMQPSQQTGSLAQTAPPAPHLTQMNFGRQAEFGLCTPPACPAITPKTLAPPLPHATLPTLRPLVESSTLSAGEEIIAASPDTTTGSSSPFRRASAPLSKTATVHFMFGDASLSAADKVALNRAVAAALDAKQIVISGRTDSIGSASTNELLAAARARAVTDYLRAAHPHLAPVLRLDAQGACCYVAPNNTEQGRSLNRRVDVHFSSDGR
ncbi:MAG: OmpA family protein [Rhodoferax sp.]|jgi:outer membrane protein OmpA-like peptidoglycan-associated protein|nr:OmpA family protein [Rhodoferax sp.]